MQVWLVLGFGAFCFLSGFGVAAVLFAVPKDTRKEFKTKGD
jgi:hypothetical protein